jgi:adenosylcobalamin-dependent ribonucleoside-triphosphate reductase
MQHQRWLWEGAQGKPLSVAQQEEINELEQLILTRQVSLSGRTLWLGGTSVAKRRAASQFNCSFLRVESVHDLVDAFWLLLQGCGVGFAPAPGLLSGFARPIELEIIQTDTPKEGGNPANVEYRDGVTWRIQVGDSAESWAKAVGKILAGKGPERKLVLDLTNIRPAGIRLKGYGWVSAGTLPLAAAIEGICKVLNSRVDRLLTRIDILDIMNWLGTVLSSRRSAQIALSDYGAPEWREFSTAKKEYWVANPQRAQSNNSLVFRSKPSKFDLDDIFGLMAEAGGSEPGFINAEAALRRAPWWSGTNPCGEILLGSHSFCNLVEVDLGKFNYREAELVRAITLVARANYRQTCVNLVDGVLQRRWHEGNEFLRLCGVGVTGVVRWQHQTDAFAWRQLKYHARSAAAGMALELGTPSPKAVTTIKPSGTLSKIMDTTEGLHKPLGKYIFNNVVFGRHDPLLPKLRAAGYNVFDHPTDPTAALVTFPVAWSDVEFTNVNGNEVNIESAVDQLNRYKLVMDNYVDHNASITVSYSPAEVPSIIRWLDQNWDSYVGVSFLYRADPTKRAVELGYPYLPQEVVTQAEYEDYAKNLEPVNLDSVKSTDDLLDTECVAGVCPVR